jgi:UDP-glucose 4-epimerase
VSVLVTGGAGALGRQVVARLLDDGADVVVLDPAEVAQPGRREVAVVGDVRDVDSVEQVLRTHGVDRIAHLAGLVGGIVNRDPDRAIAVNVVGTMNVLEAASRAGLGHVVVISSKAVVGPLDGRYVHPHYDLVPDDIARRPDNVYGLTKLALEQVAERHAIRTGLAVTALRFATMYGPGKAGGANSAFGFVSTLVERVLAGEDVRVDGGDQRNDLLYVGDMAQSVVRALAHPGDGYRLFQIGTGRAESLHDVAAALVSAAAPGRLEVESGLDPSGRGPGRYYVFDIAPAQAALGYEPAFDLPSGVRDYARQLGHA